MADKKRSAKAASSAKSKAGGRSGALSPENQSRDVIASLVHDAITDAMLGKADASASNGAGRAPRPRVTR